MVGETFQQLGLALLLGLLVGMQRERADSQLGGFRTFPLITVFGTLCALLARSFGGWVLAAGLAGVIAALVVGNLHKLRQGEPDPGLTTEIAMLVMYGVGAYLTAGPVIVGIAIGGGVALLLHLKPQLHDLARRLEDEDVRAIMQFVLIAFLVLPVLPDRAFGPFSVLNPYDIWRMVVLIVGISLGGYLVYKFLGEQAGMLLGGVLGGVISSTATTVSFARRSRAQPEGATAAALIILIASTVVYVRVLVEIQVVAPGFFPVAAPRILALMAVSVALCFVWWRRARGAREEMPEPENPSELKPAILFGVLYAGVLLAVEAARAYLGPRGLFLVAGLSGLTDMDAITLSTSRMVAASGLDPRAGWQMIVLASLSNLVFKAGIVATMGHRKLFRQILSLFGLCALAGVLILFLA